LLQDSEKKKPLFVDVIPIRQRPTGEIDEQKMVEEITKYREKAKVAYHNKMTAVKQSEVSLQKKMPSVAGYYSEMVRFKTIAFFI